jgi:hypothetical protein
LAFLSFLVAFFDAMVFSPSFGLPLSMGGHTAICKWGTECPNSRLPGPANGAMQQEWVFAHIWMVTRGM